MVKHINRTKQLDEVVTEFDPRPDQYRENIVYAMNCDINYMNYMNDINDKLCITECEVFTI